MSASATMQRKPVGDSVPKINNELAVGADLKFQRRWWRFENTVWWSFGVIVVLDLLGCFGRGPVAKATLDAPDGSMNVKFERIERYGTPSIITINFGKAAIHEGKVNLLISESMLEQLGNQRVVPQPADSQIGEGKVLYTFPASTYPATVLFSLQPTRIGLSHMTLQVPGLSEVKAAIFVMP